MESDSAFVRYVSARAHIYRQLDAKGLNRRPVSCGVASWRFLGLSFAGWNIVASAALALGSMAAAAAIRKQPPSSAV